MGIYAGKKAVVTGGTHGIGLAVVRRLLDGGAEVLLTGRDEANHAAARDELSGRAAHVLRSDAADMADIDALGTAVAERLGSVDFVFVNVGHARMQPIGEVTEEAYDRMFAVKAKGAFFTTQRLVPLVNRGGSFVFTTAVLDGFGFGGTSVATGTVAAVRGFASAFASEFLPLGIRVNALSPGFTQTPSMGIVFDSPADKAANQGIGEELTPMSRHADPDEIAKAALFLGFDATFSTGIVLNAHGGLATVAG
ncbi:SDR family oxidoreductase [Phytomonospora endophytica]|uniref:NAD(P)-dependent dehydrogenase (Short-subunit alcohol dehydrogenase family) n=1 Tax=Phytomonospora endophytica TaxID=714109 RepID=A0A841FA23_9ACTN|nr:SDR family oxidoreductase [Phytomonospora endophytica]MBB6032594.1 NAD(P)-dependent dehydrogenase (short-subunit alcohol dehydrogenase family) [Phytomonospora endophytica]GIG66256.1 oxidoreductase [Phytomonospora endophytica]